MPPATSTTRPPNPRIPTSSTNERNKIIGPIAEKLMAALIDRDNWRRSSESLAAELDAAHREVDGLKEDLELERLGYGKNSRMTEALAAS